MLKNLMFKKLLIVLKKLKKTEFEFAKPPKKKYLIFDYMGSYIFYKYIKNSNILHTRFEKLNLYILFINLLKRKFSKLDYFNTFLKYANPKIILSSNDTNPAYFLLNKYKHQKKILVQNQWKSKAHDRGIFKQIYKKNENIKSDIDILFVFNRYIMNYYKNLSPKKIIITGSPKSNLNIIKNKKKLYDLLFISSWNKMDPNFLVSANLNFKKYTNLQISILNNIYKYVKNYKMNFYILGKKFSGRNNLEYIFYNNIFKDIKWTYLDPNIYNSYEVVDKSKLVLNFHSTLGYESLSRGNKTIFFDPFSKFIEGVNFGWPYDKLKKNGIFWTTKTSYKSCEKIINNLKNMKKSTFFYLKRKIFNDLLPYNKNNSKFENEIKKIQ